MSRRRVRRADPLTMMALDAILAENTRDRNARTAALVAAVASRWECPACGTAQPAEPGKRATAKMLCWTCMRNTVHVRKGGA
jgi:hypothetical protein